MALASTPAPDPSAREVLRARYASQLPTRLDELTGPTHGTVDLPLHVVWSGLSSFDLDRPKLRMSLYRTVLTEGLHDDLVAFLNRDLLIQQWPVLRTLISRAIRDVWEHAFTELAAARSTSAA